MHRRDVLRALGACLMAVGTPHALAQSTPYPAKPLRLLVGFPPGAQTDAIARLVAAKLGDHLGQSVVVENRSGASGTIAADAAARSPADGYTLLIGGNSNMVLGPLMFDNLRYDPVRDFVAIGRIARVPLVAAVNANVPAKTLPELLELIRARPDTLTYGSGAVGTQVAVEYLLDSAGVRAVNVPYKGTAPAVIDVVAGRIDFIFADYAVLAPHANAGTLRLLATTGTAHGHDTGTLPTVAELGIRGFAYYSWSAIMAPAGTPPDVVASLRRALIAIVKMPDVKEALMRMGFEVSEESPDAFGASIGTDIERFRPIVRQAGLAGTGN